MHGGALAAPAGAAAAIAITGTLQALARMTLRRVGELCISDAEAPSRTGDQEVRAWERSLLKSNHWQMNCTFPTTHNAHLA